MTRRLEDYTRVSTILSWIEDRDRKVPMSVQHKFNRSAKGEIGTNVHTAIDHLIKGEFPIVGEKEIGYVTSFEKWRNAESPSYIATEERYYDDKNMLTGQIDALVKLHNEKRCVLVDYKTSAQESPNWILQAHFYYHLVSQIISSTLSERFIFLKLRKDGKAPDVYEYCFDKSIYDYCMEEMRNYFNEASVDKIVC